MRGSPSLLVGVLAGAALLAGCSGGEADPSPTASVPSAAPSASATPSPSATSVEPSPEPEPEPSASSAESTQAPAEFTPVTDANFIEATEAAGIECEGSLDGIVCAIDGGNVPVGMPADWSADAELRRDACEQGYINEDYQVVGDDATWFAAPDSVEQGQFLIDALAAAGYSTGFFAYCA